MKLIIITRPTFFVEEDKILSILFDEGLDNLHLKKPDTLPLYSERLLSLLPEHSARHTTVHDHYYLKNEYGLAGIHLDDEHAPIPEGYRGKVSRTCTSTAAIKDARKSAEYVFLQTDYSLLRRSDRYGEELVNTLRTARKQGIIDKKVYACGGISLEIIPTLKSIGFGGIVVGKDLWNKFDIHGEQDFKPILEHFKKLNKAIK